MSAGLDRVLAPLLTQAVVQEPYEFYRALRAEPRLSWSEELGGWMVARYHDIKTGLDDDRLFAARQDKLFESLFADRPSVSGAVKRFNGRSMFFLDEPRHTEARHCFNAGIRQRGHGQFLQAISAAAAQAADDFVARGGGDLVAQFAAPLSVCVMKEMVGCSQAECERMLTAINTMIGLFGRSNDDTFDPASVMTAVRALEEVIGQLIEAAPDAADMSVLAAVKSAAAVDDADLIVGVATDLVAAGYVPLTNAIGNTLACLLAQPDLVRAVRGQKQLAARVIEESCRLEAPNQLTSRIAREPFTLLAERVAAGELVYFLLASGNRDEAVYERPDMFDIERKASRSLAFGSGRHACIGARLATDAASTAIQALLSRAAEISLAGPPRWRAETLRVRALDSLVAVCR